MSPHSSRDKLGHAARDLALFERALTHSSLGRDSYERLEFLGDRVLGLVVGALALRALPAEPEGKLSRRYNALVARETCAEIGREIGVPPHDPPRQAGPRRRRQRQRQRRRRRGRGADRRAAPRWRPRRRRRASSAAPGRRTSTARRARRKHPKSALQELAAARRLHAPVYELVSAQRRRTTPRASPSASRSAAPAKRAPKARSKQEAETAGAPTALLEQTAR